MGASERVFWPGPGRLALANVASEDHITLATGAVALIAPAFLDPQAITKQALKSV